MSTFVNGAHGIASALPKIKDTFHFDFDYMKVHNLGASHDFKLQLQLTGFDGVGQHDTIAGNLCIHVANTVLVLHLFFQARE